MDIRGKSVLILGGYGLVGQAIAGVIQPGKVVGWVFAVEEQGARMK